MGKTVRGIYSLPGYTLRDIARVRAHVYASWKRGNIGRHNAQLAAGRLCAADRTTGNRSHPRLGSSLPEGSEARNAANSRRSNNRISDFFFLASSARVRLYGINWRSFSHGIEKNYWDRRNLFAFVLTSKKQISICIDIHRLRIKIQISRQFCYFLGKHAFTNILWRVYILYLSDHCLKYCPMLIALSARGFQHHNLYSAAINSFFLLFIY